MKSPLPVAALGLAFVACSSSSGNQQRPPAREPVSTTTVTRSTVVTEPGAGAGLSYMSEDDRKLVGEIRRHLGKEPALEDVAWRDIEIVNVDGRVRLTGSLPTIAEAIEVEQAVREVEGVTAVTNDIRRPEGSVQP